MSSPERSDSLVTEAITRAAVIGGGSFGTALALVLARKGCEVSVWARAVTQKKGGYKIVSSNPALAFLGHFMALSPSRVNETRENSKYLPGVKLPDSIQWTTSVEEAVAGVEMVLLVIPTQFLRNFVATHRDILPVGVPIVLCAKGIEVDSCDTPYQIVEDELPGKYSKYLAVLAGPSFAKEMAQNQPTNVTVASKNKEVATRVQNQLSSREANFRVYTSDDFIGCEICGAVKNVLAIASGASTGLGFGNNTRAALICRGLAELNRLARKMGSNSKCMSGLAGVGDLLLTCSSELSRNFTVGYRLAKGETLDEINSSMKSVAEGVATAKSLHTLAAKLDVDMPISGEVYKVLYQGKDIREALMLLQSRPLREELGTGSLTGAIQRPRRALGEIKEDHEVVDTASAAHQTFIVLQSGACLACGSNVTSCMGGAAEGETDAMWPVFKQIPSVPLEWKVKQVACGSDLALGAHTVLVTSTGRVFTLGCAKLCGVGPTDEDVIHTPALITRFVIPWHVAEGKSSIRISSCSAGGACSAVVSTDGTVFTFGALASGRLGYRRPHSGGDYQLRPRAIRLESPAEQVVCGAAHMLSIGVNGRLWAWGENSAGQLGQGHLLDEYSPVRVHHPSHGSAWSPSISACGGSSAAIDRVGRLYLWGHAMVYRGGSGASERYATVATTFGIRKISFPWAWPHQIRGLEGSGARINDAWCTKEGILFRTSEEVLYEWKNQAVRSPEGELESDDDDDEDTTSSEEELPTDFSSVSTPPVPRIVELPFLRHTKVSAGPQHAVAAGHIAHLALAECGRLLLEGRQHLPHADHVLGGIAVHGALLRHRLSAGAYLAAVQPQMEAISHTDEALLDLVEEFRASSAGKKSGIENSSADGDRTGSTTARTESRVEGLIDTVLVDDSEEGNNSSFPEIPDTLRFSSLPSSVVMSFLYFIYTDGLPSLARLDDTAKQLLAHIARCLDLPRLLALVEGDDAGCTSIPRVLSEMLYSPWPEFLDAELPCGPCAVGHTPTTRLRAHMFILAAQGLSPSQFETVPVDFAKAILCFVYTQRLPRSLKFPRGHWVAFAETANALGLYSLAAVASDRVMRQLSDNTWASIAIETEGSRSCKLVHLTALAWGVTEAVVHVRQRMSDLRWFTEPEDLVAVEPRVEKLLGTYASGSGGSTQLGFLRRRRPGLYNELRDSVSRDVKEAIQAESVVMQHVSYYDKLSDTGDTVASESSGPEFRGSIARCLLELIALLTIAGLVISVIRYATTPEAPVWARNASDWLTNYETLVIYSGGPALKVVVNVAVAAATVMYMFKRLSS
ncbi:hypothetical protein FOL47_008124 [Perkinsus chesapeaki]|uniref:Glycerol-3-phosphate dehydrogenase [NAD(+)] n=1 Tax=Perkinsus chesapeaki TaxID=330153 RepID=A0A7J6LH94_PERCH|nr:hypothetical protein FOL47_008124 [Perkinsus chesapeaki]